MKFVNFDNSICYGAFPWKLHLYTHSFFVKIKLRKNSKAQIAWKLEQVLNDNLRLKWNVKKKNKNERFNPQNRPSQAIFMFTVVFEENCRVGRLVWEK